eukprot:2608777-Pyramimonas_sp.AAC.1
MPIPAMRANHRGKEIIFLMWEPITGGRGDHSQHATKPILEQPSSPPRGATVKTIDVHEYVSARYHLGC